MLPQINGIGTLTRQPEQRFAQSGSSIVNFGLAFNEKYKSADGQQKENVTFIDCTVFGKLGEKVIIPYINKGDKLYIIGKLRLEQWGKDGQKRSKHSITVESVELLGCKGDNQQNSNTPAPQQSNPPQQEAPQNNTPQQSQQGAYPTIPEIDMGEDEIPFSGISKRLAMSCA